VSRPDSTARRLGSNPGKWGLGVAAVWLLYLVPALVAGWQHRGSVRGWLGILLTLGFAVAYMAVFARMRHREPGTPFRVELGGVRGWAVVLGLVLLGVADCWAIGQAGTATAVYVAVIGVICLPALLAWATSLAVGLASFVASVTVPGWDRDTGVLFGAMVATLAMWGITQAVNRSVDLLAVREDNARLELADERNRFARDLHDILGHSLTVITVKAQLASRLLDLDTERARAELADLERLSRDALSDVRRAVEGYRELTLPGELARARTALAAAEIEADLPGSADEVPSEVRELFAWTIREGVTNVIRHSGARRCRVVLASDHVEVRDDGPGPVDDPAHPATGLGHGLLGLRERAAAVGATVHAERLSPGFALRVSA
jgi:two-component system sensor histidine kinase DesK